MQKAIIANNLVTLNRAVNIHLHRKKSFNPKQNQVPQFFLSRIFLRVDFQCRVIFTCVAKSASVEINLYFTSYLIVRSLEETEYSSNFIFEFY